VVPTAPAFTPLTTTQVVPPQQAASTRVGERVRRPGNWTYRGLRRRWHLALAIVIAAAMVAAAVITTESLDASASTNFPGVLSSANPEYLNFVNQGVLTSVDVTPGEQVSAGQILATQYNLPQAAAVNRDNVLLASDTEALAALLGDSGKAAAAEASLLLTKAQSASNADQQHGAALLAQGEAQVSAAEAQLTAANGQLAADQAAYKSQCPGGTGKGCTSLSRDIALDQAAVSRAGSRLSSAQVALTHDQGLNTTLSQLATQVQEAADNASSSLLPSTFSDIRLARDAVANDSYQDTSDLAALAGTEMVAPGAGIVTGVYASAGELVGASGTRAGSTSQSSTVPGGTATSQTVVPSSPSNSSAASQPFISIDAAGLEAVAQVPEARIPSIFVGENARVTVNAISGSGATLHGKVQSIDLVPVLVNGAVYYNVTVVPLSGSWSSALLPGMTTNVAIP
jgi:multidrug resistance efflux pump